MKQKVGNVGGKVFWAIPIKDCNGGTSVDDRIPKMYFWGRKVKNGRDAEGDEAKGLEMRK